MKTKDAVQLADHVGGSTLPAVIAAVVGIYRLVTVGPQWNAIAMIAGGIITWLAVPAYIRAASAPPGRGWGGAAGSFGIMFPWAFSLYLMSYEGAFRAYQGITGAGIGSIAIGLFWIIAGWRMLYVLGKITRTYKSA